MIQDKAQNPMHNINNAKDVVVQQERRMNITESVRNTEGTEVFIEGTRSHRLHL